MHTDTLILMFKDIRNNIDILNEWEVGFIGSIEDQVLNGRILSPSQLLKLDNIYEKITENDR